MQHGGKRILVIDLGGTNLRAAFADPSANELFDVQKIKLDCIDEFYNIVDELIKKYPGTEDLVVSVAGPKNGNSITMTNRNWKIVSSDVQERYGLRSCHLLNDWEAIAYSLSSLKEDDLRILKKGQFVGLNDIPKFVIGPGTGLGAALYSRVRNIEHVNPTELGNTQTSVNHYLKIFGIEDSSSFEILEDVLSGPGISKVSEIFLNESLTPEEILVRAKEGDSVCTDLIQKYIQCFAVLSSESALSYNCHGGIFLVGSFMRGLESFINDEIFAKQFIGKRKQIHADFLNGIPVFLVKRESTPLYGNLNYFKSTIES